MRSRAHALLVQSSGAAAGRRAAAMASASVSAPWRALHCCSSVAHAAAGVSAAAAPASRPAPSLPPRPRLNLLSLSLAQLESHLVAMGLPRFRAKQLLHWVYARGARSIHAMDNFSRSMADKLAERFTIDYGAVIEQKVSDADYTRKFVVGFPSARQKLALPVVDAAGAPSPPPPLADRIECVYIPKGKASDYASASEGAVCVSSQVGCSLSCTFCHTGTMDKKKLRNLTAAEIVGQVMLVQQALGDFDATAAHRQPDGAASKRSAAASAAAFSSSSSRTRAVTNVVFMGMGEPLYNYRNVSSAIHTLTSSPTAGGVGLGFGRPRITVSTSGVVPGIDALLQDFGGSVGLAISLHACNDRLRDEIVPINRTFPLTMLMDAVRRYQNGWGGSGGDGGAASDSLLVAPSGRKRITFEYVMLAGVNDSLSEALALARLLSDVVSLVNLIPFNPWEGSPYVSSAPEHILRFAAELQRLGVPCTIRWPRGRDIQGACGQLAIKHAAAQI